MKQKITHPQNRLSKLNYSKFQITVVAVLFAGVGAFIISQIFAATAGTFSLTPGSSNVALGNSFTVSVYEDSGTATVNAVEADLTFPTDKLQFVSIDATTSAFGIEAVSTGNNTNGTVTLARGVSGGTSVTGKQLIGKVTFTTKAAGAAVVNFAATSAIVDASTNANLSSIVRTGATYTIADTTAPTVPSGLTIGTRTINSIAFTWTASTDNIGVAGYKVYRNGTQVGTSATTTYTDSSLTPNTSYSYTVAAYDAAGNTSGQSTALATSTLPDTAFPTVPSGLTVGTRTINSIAFTWTASTDNVAVAGYKIYRGGVQIATSASASYTNTGLTPNTSYSYTVAAYDAAGNTSGQSTALATSTLPDTTAPAIPTGLKSTSQSNTSVGLSWTASTDNVAVAGYKIYRGGVQVGTSTTTSYTDSSGLVVGTSYSYTVAAYDAAGNTSAQSTAISVTTTKAGDVNGDNLVNIYDLSLLLSNYNKTTGQLTNTAIDINQDGVVDVFDLSILLSKYGS